MIIMISHDIIVQVVVSFYFPWDNEIHSKELKSVGHLIIPAYNLINSRLIQLMERHHRIA
ncbi:hypothetical protein HZS_221 [Henneguya salminicola]|nr:hypothetical protein HZS_221 [Henneguya salminicola]